MLWRREGPTGATLSLVLDGSYCTLLPPVHTLGQHNILIGFNEVGTTKGSAGLYAEPPCHPYLLRPHTPQTRQPTTSLTQDKQLPHQGL
ncbi:hypothetical protein E2C01_031328 [Portunus trituberculatus]|uniref:Uncharacterized protein n=1 Tax=Portunus trituberculatus TaxID=210409 RepID=A0A5B7EZS9_PORTR|nr:hypothetical protein [Portunus trituberculatus]